MRYVLLILTICLVFSAFVVPVQAAPVTVWLPTESGEIDVNTLYLGDFDLAIFDVDDTDFSFPFQLAKPGDTVFFNQVGSDWELTSSQTSNTITLEDSFHFILALDDNGTWVGSTDFAKIAFGIFNVSWGAERQLIIIDAQPVPLPASILLLATGVLAFIGIRRRK